MLLVGTQALAQTTESRPAQATTVITGRVVASSDNFPIANARILGRAAGGPSSVRIATTDDDGKFQLTNLAPANYVIRVAAAGYVPDLALTDIPVYRPGENVTLRMIKGGVITGRVVNQNGQPMALARVRAVRVKDAEGNAVRDSAVRDWTTDDRGIYRAYGLEPGAYVVSANGTTYHPSATLDTAIVVNVVNGNETGGVDIKYRPEHSYAVSGMIVGGAAQGDAPLRRAIISVTLSHATSGVTVAFTTIVPNAGNSVFNFDAVPDGVYELTAQAAPGSKDATLAPPQLVTVRGASVTGIVLTLMPMGSVSGRVLIETESCAEVPATSLQETLITAKAETQRSAKPAPPVASLLPVEAQPDTRGEFLLTNMSAGKYALNVKLASSRLYVREIAREPGPMTARFNLLTLKSGQHVNGLIIKLASGAASVTGRVSADTDLPSRLNVYAVPAKREHADEVLRYAHAQVQPDGSFSLKHLAPDRYFLLPISATDLFDPKARAALRRDAERANVSVDFKPCQRVTGYTLRVTP